MQSRSAKTAWNVHPVGFGGYRISDSEPFASVGGQSPPSPHREALRLALLSGCNLIDTSANYGDGASERLVGAVLAELFSEGKLKREDVRVVTKAGYIQGGNMKMARERAESGKPWPELVRYSDNCWHCISPEFLEDQLTHSLDRLKLDRVDALLLHNPEYFLKAGGEAAEYYRRIETAFAHLEREVSRGRIGCYGISSNTFPEPREAADFTSLEMVTEIAEKVGGPNHHFEVIQFPFNVYEPGAALEENVSDPAAGARTVLEYATRKGLLTLANRPLNAFSQKGMIRLADFPAHENHDIVGEFKEAMTRAAALEAAYPARALVPARSIAWGHILRENFERLSDLDSWKSLLTYRIEPSLRDAFEILEEHEEFRGWSADYRKASTELFKTYTRYLESQASAKSDRIAGQLDHLCPELQTSKTLSQKVIRLYRSVAGLDCILVGMRQTHYVRDALDLQAPVTPENARRTLLEMHD